MRPRQLDLFSRPTTKPWSAEIESLAAQLDPHIHLGASSWTFPGWAGICYPKDVTEEQLNREGLKLDSRFPLFRTVGIYSSYYRPIQRDRLADYASQLPSGFRCLEKVSEHIVAPVFPMHARYGARAGCRNDTFLNAEVFFEEIHRPHVGVFEQNLACYVLEFPPTTVSVFEKPAMSSNGWRDSSTKCRTDLGTRWSCVIVSCSPTSTSRCFMRRMCRTSTITGPGCPCRAPKLIARVTRRDPRRPCDALPGSGRRRPHKKRGAPFDQSGGSPPRDARRRGSPRPFRDEAETRRVHRGE